MESLLTQLLHEQQRTNNLLRELIEVQRGLIEVMAEDLHGDEDAEPAVYLDGSKCR